MASIPIKNATLYANQESTEGDAAAGVATDAILARNIKPKYGQQMNTREYQGAPGTRDLVPGAQLDAGISFETEIKANGSNNTPEIDELLQACFGSVTAGTATTEINGGTSTTTSLVVDSSAGFDVGNAVAVEVSSGIFEVTWITAIPDGTHLTVSPALSAAPGDNADVAEMRTYQIAMPPPSVNSLTFDLYWTKGSGASMRDRFVGSRGNVKMGAIDAGDIPMLMWEFASWAWSQVVNGTRPDATYDTALPKPALSSKFKVNGTQVFAHGHEWDLGAVLGKKTSPNASSGVFGIPHVDYNPKGKFIIDQEHDSIAEFTALTAGSTMSLIQQFGSSLNGMWAWHCPRAVREAVEGADREGNRTNEIGWRASTQNDAVATSFTTGPAQFYLAVG